MTTLPIHALSAQSVADLVEDLENRLRRARDLAPLAPACYGAEIAVTESVLHLLDNLLRRPLEA